MLGAIKKLEKQLKRFSTLPIRLSILLMLLFCSVGFVGGQYATGRQFKNLTDNIPFFMSVYYYAGCITGGGGYEFCTSKQKEVYEETLYIHNEVDRLIKDRDDQL